MKSISWVSCQIRRIEVCACAGNVGIVFPATAGKRSRHASRHALDARAVMHVGIVNSRFPLKSVAEENVPGIPGACASRNFTYVVRGPYADGTLWRNDMGTISSYLCRESDTNSQKGELWCFIYHQTWQAVDHTVDWRMIRDAMTPIWRHWNVWVWVVFPWVCKLLQLPYNRTGDWQYSNNT